MPFLVLLAICSFCSTAYASWVPASDVDTVRSARTAAVGDSLRAATNVRDSAAAATLAARPSIGRDRSLTPGIFDLVTNLPGDWRDYYLRDVTLGHWPMMALISASTAAMIVYDNQMWQPFRKLYETSTPAHQVADWFVFMGDGKFQFGLAGAFAGYGVVAGDKRALRTASQTCEVILACGAVVQLLKHLTGRESPFVATTPTGRWQFFPNQIEYAKHVPHYDAFPSGHLATATATLTVIANNYPEATWVKPVGYVALAGIATGLVTSGIHWWSDFPLALALGYGFGTLVSPDPDRAVASAPAEQKEIGENSFYHELLTHATILPTLQPGGAGVSMSVQF